MMPPPIVQDSDYVDPVEFTESGPYQPQAMESFTVMKAEIQDRPSYKEDYSVDFLKYVHATETVSALPKPVRFLRFYRSGFRNPSP